MLNKLQTLIFFSLISMFHVSSYISLYKRKQSYLMDVCKTSFSIQFLLFVSIIKSGWICIIVQAKNKLFDVFLDRAQTNNIKNTDKKNNTSKLLKSISHWFRNVKNIAMHIYVKNYHFHGKYCSLIISIKVEMKKNK